MATVTKASIKVNRAISGATTVGSNCYAIVTYLPSGTGSVGSGDFAVTSYIEKYFGPGQSIPATISVYSIRQAGTGSNQSNVSVSYSLSSGVEFINT